MIGDPFHHSSHAALLRRPEVEGALGHVDAIIVPAARPAGRLRDVMLSARTVGCSLLILCSRDAGATRTAALAEDLDADVIAVDLPAVAPLPSFETTRLLRGTRFQTGSDAGIKRNLGLLLAKMAGWERIVFLDDDIAGVEPKHLRRAAHLLGSYQTVALGNAGFPDNSMVCHAHRATGGFQDTFVGAGALAVAVDSTRDFFPDVYNEDWLFLLERVQDKQVATIGQMAQDAYDPFASPRRARVEEFGDCLAEGLYCLLDEGYSKEDATEEYWSRYIDGRRRFITMLLDRVATSTSMAPDLRERMRRSLTTARRSLALVTPPLLVRYLGAWESDRSRWQKLLDGPRTTVPITAALKHLGLAYQQRRRKAHQVGLVGRPWCPSWPPDNRRPRPAIDARRGRTRRRLSRTKAAALSRALPVLLVATLVAFTLMQRG